MGMLLGDEMKARKGNSIADNNEAHLKLLPI